MSERPFSCPPSCEEFIRQCERLRNGPKFHPGDVVNTGRTIGRDNPTFRIDKDGSTGLPYRYLVEGMTEEGLVYGKLLSPSGKGKSKVINWSDEIRIDSEYMDMLILNATDTFDPSAELKEEKKKVTKIRRHNKDLSIKKSSLVEWEELLSTWEVGKRVWTMWSGSMERPIECTVTNVSKKNNSGFGSWDRIDKYPPNKEYTIIHLESVTKNSEGNPQYKPTISINDFKYEVYHIYITDQEPIIYKKKGEV